MNLRERQRVTPSSASEERDLDSAHSDDEPWPVSASKRVKRRHLRHVSAGLLSYPQSAYEGYVPSMAPMSAANALQTLSANLTQGSGDSGKAEYTYFDLDDISIYRPNHKNHEDELAALDCLQVRRSFDDLVFDGFLSVNNQRIYVQGVRFKVLAVNGYGDGNAAHVEGKLSIQSPLASTHDVWYKLCRPSSTYQRFYEPFKWLTEFTNHFVNYLLVIDDVTLADFRKNFFTWLSLKYSGHKLYDKWHLECNNMRDFWTTVVSNIEFVWKECHCIDDSETSLMLHLVWNAAYEFRGIDEQPMIEENTIVTPFVY